MVDKYIIPFSALSFVLSSVLLSTLIANSSASFKVGGSLYSCFSMETAACVAGGIREGEKRGGREVGEKEKEEEERGGKREGAERGDRKAGEKEKEEEERGGRKVGEKEKRKGGGRERGQREEAGGGRERKGGPTIINFFEQDRTSYHLPGDCYQCRWLSTLHSYRWGHSGRVGNHGEDPTPCRGWTHRTDASLDEREERKRRKEKEEGKEKRVGEEEEKKE